MIRFFSRNLSDFANARAFCAYDDALLAFPLDVDDCSNVHRRATLAELLDSDGDAVWDLIMKLLEHRLANELRDKKAH